MNRTKTKVMNLLFAAAFVLSMVLVGQVHVNAATAAPTGLTQTDATTSSVDIKWNAVMQDDIYYYYRISDNANFTSYKSDYAWTYTTDYISGLSAGSSYYVQVGTSTKNTWGSAPADTVWSSAIEVVTCPEKVEATTIKQTGATTTSITLGWTAPAGATRYSIKYWPESGKEDTAKTVTSAKNSVTLKSLAKNKEYSIKIYSERTSSAGYTASYSNYGYVYGIGVLPTKVTGVENTTFYSYSNSADFEWKSLGSADGYKYYVYNNSGKKILSGTTNGARLSLYSSKLSSAQFYRIKVCGYINLANNKVKCGECSDVLYFARTPHSKVNAKQSGSNIKVSWNKVTGATGYTVYVSTKEKSGYKKAVTITKGSKTSTTIKKYGNSKLKKGKTYYIRVVANKKVKVNNKSKTYTSNVYFDYSDSVTMKK